MSDEWESVTAPRGEFIGWGAKEGQKITGEVVHLDLSGGKDPNGNPVPELTIKLTEEGHSYTKGEWKTFEVGTIVKITCSQYSLKEGVPAARVNPGDLIRIELTELRPTSKSPQKVFDIKVRRNSAPAPVQAPVVAQAPAFAAPAQQGSFGGGDYDDSPPF